MSGTTIAVFALTIAGYGTGWWARGSSSARARPAGDELPDDARRALARALDACRAALDSPTAAAQARDALAAAEAVDVALESRLGDKDPRYARFDRMLNVLASVEHQVGANGADSPRLQALRTALAGVASELDAPRP